MFWASVTSSYCSIQNTSTHDGGSEVHTFESYLHLRKEGNCHVAMLPKLCEPVPCICSEWHNERQAMNVGKLVLEGRTCFKCAKEICEKTHYLQDLAPLGSGCDRPLHHAAITNNLTMFFHLITLVGENGDHQAAVQALRATNERAETALHAAVIAGFRDLVRLMLWVDPHLCTISCDGVSPIYLAVSLRRMDIAKVLHDALDDADDAARGCYYSGPNGQNALHAAMTTGRGDMITLVLSWDKYKFLTQQADENGNTPLHLAAFAARPRPWSWTPLRVTAFWHILNADPDMAYKRNNRGLAPIHVAAMTNQWDAIEILCRNRIGCMFLRDDQGRTFLHVTVQNNGLRIVNYICRRSKFAQLMNIRDKNGNTALHLAVDAQNQGIVCALLRNQSVSLNMRNNKGQTVLDLAKSRIRAGFYYSQNPDKVIYNLLVRVRAGYSWNLGLEHATEQGNVDKKDEEKERKRQEEKEESDKLTSATQTLGIGAVLIATVTFGATFGLPGGYKADDHVNGGTPTLAGRWFFDAFMVANTLAFLCSTLATLALMYSGMPMVSLHLRYRIFNESLLFAWSSVISLAAPFALGVYMVLAPVARSTAVAICTVCPLMFLYGIVRDLHLFFFVLLPPTVARRGFLYGMMYLAQNIFSYGLLRLWPLVVIFGWAGHLRTKRLHG